jgi:MFS family permease
LPGLTAILCSIPAGLAIQRIGIKPVLIVALAMVSCGLLLLSLSQTFLLLALTRGLWQCGLRFALPAFDASVALAVQERFRARALGVGAAFALSVAVVEMKAVGALAEAAGWHVSFRVLAASTAVALIAVLLIPKAEFDAMQMGASSRETSREHVYLDPSMWLLCLLVIFSSSEGLADSLAVVQMQEVWQTTAAEFASIAAIGLAFAVVVSLSVGWAADRYGIWTILGLVCAMNFVSAMCLALGEGLKAAYVVGILLSKGFQVATPFLAVALAPSLCGNRDVGPVVALVALGIGVGQFVGPQALGVLRDYTGSYVAGWYYLAAVALLSLAIVHGLKRHFVNP